MTDQITLDTISAKTFRTIFKRLKEQGKVIAPRGQKVIEVEHFTYELPAYVRFQSFESRKLKIDYVKNEVLWYLRGNRSDQTILEHASMWQSLVNNTHMPGTINSNYGQYIFGSISDPYGTVMYEEVDALNSAAAAMLRRPQHKTQFDAVIKTLSDDKDSRRASITILQPYHLVMATKDVPCTYSMNFRIRDNKLNMSVHMRSQDGIFGMGNDAPAFSIIQEMIYVMLRDTKYPELEMGTYTHTADSFHVYERHFEMLDKIVAGDAYLPIACPKIKSADEVRHLRGSIHLLYEDGKQSINYQTLAQANAAMAVATNLVTQQAASSLTATPAEFKFSEWLLQGAKAAEAKKAAAQQAIVQ
jgi:thymidylate synthase